MVITEKGFERPNYDDLLEAQIDRAKEMFGEDIDTNDNTPLGKYIRLNVKDLAECYEILEQIYFARFPNSATGQSLDRLCPFAGITRNQASYATHTITFKGTAGEYVPSGFEVSANNGTIIFHTYEPLKIGTDGTVDGVVECEEAGEIGNVAVGKIDTIVNPSSVVDSITHKAIASLGSEIETDAELRLRFYKSVAGGGSGTVASIEAAIMRVPLVEGVAIIENNTNQTSSDGLPAHSFETYVLAPTSQDDLIAQAIFDKKPLGIQACGGVTKTVYDSAGIGHGISFSRTLTKDVYLNISLYKNHLFPSDGEEQIKNNITLYINNLKNGEIVAPSALYSYIHKVDGVVSVYSLKTSTDGTTYSTSGIAVEDNYVARVKEIEVLADDEL